MSKNIPLRYTLALMIVYIFFFLSSLFLTDGSLLVAMSKKSALVQEIKTPMGVRTFRYEDKGRNRPVIVECWYPTSETSLPYEMHDGDVWIHPQEIRNSTIDKPASSYPLIVMSHGHRGDRRERTWLVEPLVRNGFMVISVEHSGMSWHGHNPVESLFFWNRAQDVSFALDRILEEPTLRPFINPEKIGFIGYSMGGMTGLALAGAEATDVLTVLKAHVRPEEHKIPLEYLEKIDYSIAEKSFKDSRIQSFLLICPATFVYAPETLRKINAKIGLIVSVDDEVLPHKDHGKKLLDHLKVHKKKVMKHKISHYAFLNRMTQKGLAILEKGIGDPSKIDWLSIHKEAAAFSLQFFQETLAK